MDSILQRVCSKIDAISKDRKRLLNLIYDNRDELLAKYLHDQGGEGDLLEDIDPFTVLACLIGVLNMRIG